LASALYAQAVSSAAMYAQTVSSAAMYAQAVALEDLVWSHLFVILSAAMNLEFGPLSIRRVAQNDKIKSFFS